MVMFRLHNGSAQGVINSDFFVEISDVMLVLRIFIAMLPGITMQPKTKGGLPELLALVLVDAMMKEDKQAEVYGDRQRTKQKYSLRRLPLHKLQRLLLSMVDKKHEDLVDWIQQEGGAALQSY
jgi:hypothetical protein